MHIFSKKAQCISRLRKCSCLYEYTSMTFNNNKVMIRLEFLQEINQSLSSEHDTLYDEHKLRL